MSRQTSIPLLEWRQGAGKKFISHTTQPMNSIVPDCHRFASVKLLVWINRLGAGSVAIFLALGMMGIKPAQSQLSQQQIASRKPTQTNTSSQINPNPAPIMGALPQSAIANSVQKEVSVPSTSVQVSDTSSSPSSQEVTFPLEESNTTNTDPLILAANQDNSPLSSGELIQTSSSQTAASGTSVLPPAPTNLILGQLPTLPPLPVPSNPIPGSNSTVGQLPAFPPTSQSFPVSPTMMPAGGNNYNSGWGQYPAFPQTPPTMPMGGNNYNSGWGQYPVFPQTLPSMPASPTLIPAGTNNYNPGLGQFPTSPQTVLVMPVQGTSLPPGLNNYNSGLVQSPGLPQTVILVPVSVMGSPTGINNYNPGMAQQSPYFGFAQSPYFGFAQSSYLRQTQAPLPAPLNPAGFNPYNPGMGQSPYLPQSQAPYNPGGYNPYNPGMGQAPYLPQSQVPYNPGGINPYNPSSMGGQSPYLLQSQAPYNPGMGGQSPYLPQSQVPLSPPVGMNPVQANGYLMGQYPPFPQTAPALPNVPYPNLPPAIPATTPTPAIGQGSSIPPAIGSTASRSPTLRAQGSFVTQGGNSVARGRLSGTYPLSSQALFGATLDLTSEESGLADSPGQGLNINELYFAMAPFDTLPNLRFVVGQLDLTSYFDRNSFAKDGVSHFFNSAFQTNPALSAAGIASHPGFLVNWTLNDNIEAKAAAFSSSQKLSDFALDGFAGEIGLRYGNGIIRGTYSTGRDAGSDTSFQEAFSIPRGDNGDEFGLESGDREEAYGLNAEYFVPDWNMGVFGRYGRYINRELDEKATTYSFGITFLDVFSKDDRLGLAYGQTLSNNQGREHPDVLELFYDFRFLPNMRLGFTVQQRNGLSETDVGVRVKTDFDVIPNRTN